MGSRHLMRRLIQFPCAGDNLVGTLDVPGHGISAGTTGLLIVSGGNEIRIGAHRGMAQLAAHVATAGYPVLRYDRRGIGDSSGENKGFLSSLEDLSQATSAFRREVPGLSRIIAYGNCDAASTLALFHKHAGIDGLILSNPWVIDGEEQADALPPSAAIKSRYLAKMKDPAEWLRLLRGGVDMGKLVGGLRKISSAPTTPTGGLAAQMAGALTATQAPVTILLARGDNTAIAFQAAWQSDAYTAIRARAQVAIRDSDSHSFASAADKEWLCARILEVLSG